MSGTKQYMSPENIVRPQGEEVFDLNTADLSKVDTFGLGVILINMLTGSYLFESCLSSEYAKLTSDSDYLLQVLRNKINQSQAGGPQMPEEELIDLASLIQAMIHPESSKRLSISELCSESSSDEINWLKKSLYRQNDETEIEREMYARIHSGDSFLTVFDASRKATCSESFVED